MILLCVHVHVHAQIVRGVNIYCISHVQLLLYLDQYAFFGLNAIEDKQTIDRHKVNEIDNELFCNRLCVALEI